MHQQFYNQVFDNGILERMFKLRKRGTTARTEIIAGFTTFLTMLYIVFVNPQILHATNMDINATFVTTCLITAFSSIFMGLFANLPVVLAPAIGLNTFFSFVIVQTMNISWQVGMGAIFWSAVGLLLLTLFHIRYWMIANIPVNLRVGIISGTGLFISIIGLKNAGIIVANKETLVSIGDLTYHGVILGMLGFFIIAILTSHSIHAAILISIIITTLIGCLVGDTHYHGIFSIPPSVDSIIGHVNLISSLNIDMIGIIFSFMLINLFDSSGTLISITDKAGLADEKGNFPRMKQALFIDSISSIAGSFIGTSSVTTYIESYSGISVGGRTGLTAVVAGILFLLIIFLSPLISIVPSYSVAGALIYIGVLMISSIAHVKWEDLTESVPVFITTIMIPLSFSITEGIALGFISYCVMKIGTGRVRELNSCVIVIAILFILKIIFIDKYVLKCK